MRRNFARLSRSLSFTVICVLLFGSPSKGQEESFYKGKTLRVIAGTTAGALYDQSGRVLLPPTLPSTFPETLRSSFRTCRAQAIRSPPTIFIM
jgi:hypothetical protein